MLDCSFFGHKETSKKIFCKEKDYFCDADKGETHTKAKHAAQIGDESGVSGLLRGEEGLDIGGGEVGHQPDQVSLAVAQQRSLVRVPFRFFHTRQNLQKHLHFLSYFLRKQS